MLDFMSEQRMLKLKGIPKAKNEEAAQSRFFFCLPSKAGKPVHLKESGVTLTKGKTIRMARASLANDGV